MKSDAEQKAAERAAWRARGYVLKQVWTLPANWPRIQAYIRKINKSRDGARGG